MVISPFFFMYEIPDKKRSCLQAEAVSQSVCKTGIGSVRIEKLIRIGDDRQLHGIFPDRKADGNDAGKRNG